MVVHVTVWIVCIHYFWRVLPRLHAGDERGSHLQHSRIFSGNLYISFGFTGATTLTELGPISTPIPVQVVVSGICQYLSGTSNPAVCEPDVSITGTTTLAAPPAIAPGGVVSLDSSLNTAEPSSWISIYGTNLAPYEELWNGDFPNTLASVSVTIDSKPAYLWFVSPTQINLQVPDDAKTGSVSVVVNTLAGTATSTVTLASFAPSLSLLNAKYPAAIVLTPGEPGNSGGGYDIIGPTGAFSYATRPVKAGETISFYGVGFGPTNPSIPAGQPFSGSAPLTTIPKVTIGGLPAVITYAGLIEAGLYQLNVVVPAAGSGDQPIVATVNNAATQSAIFVTLQ